MSGRLTLAVPEAAASADTIQFKLVLGGDGLESYMQRHDLAQTIAFRSFQQISWLHDRLAHAFTEVVIPPLPEPPVESRMDDQDYVERKRLQIERFFEKLMRRRVFANHTDFIHFLSNDMTPTEVGRKGKGVLSFLRFNRVMKPSSDQGFKSYKVTEPVDGDDQDTFHGHQIYILMLESYFGVIAECLLQSIQVREGLGDALAHMGDLVIETTQSKYRLGHGDKETDREAQRNLDRRMQIFGLLMDELGFIFTRQGKEETMKMVDVLIEHKNSMDALKSIFNVRTQKLMDYVDSMKHRNKKRDKADKLKLRLGLNAPEVQTTMAEEEEARVALEANRQQFNESQIKVKREMRIFEAQKSRDLTRSLNDYVQANLRYERVKLQTLEKALQEMRHAKPKPIYDLSAPEEDDGASITSTSTYDTAAARAKRRQKSRQSKDFERTLQSSASLPTWTRKKDQEDDTGSTSRVSPFARYDNPLSTSYDERMRNSPWPKD